MLEPKHKLYWCEWHDFYMCLEKLYENVLEGCNAQNYDSFESLEGCNAQNDDSIESLEGCLSWNGIHVEVNALNLSYNWWNCMAMN